MKVQTVGDTLQKYAEGEYRDQLRMVSQRNFVQSRDIHELKKEVSPSRRAKSILVLDLDETLLHYNMAED